MEHSTKIYLGIGTAERDTAKKIAQENGSKIEFDSEMRTWYWLGILPEMPKGLVKYKLGNFKSDSAYTQHYTGNTS